MKVNISIDDVSPHPRSSLSVVDKCNQILDVFPDAKFSFFVPVAYWRTMKKDVATNIPLQLNLFTKFCNDLRELPQSTYEVGYHGYYHGIPHVNDNNEMKDLNYESAVNLINAMNDVIKLADLESVFKPMIRPPAWRMSPEAFDACVDNGITLFALADIDYAIESYAGRDKTVNSTTYANMYPPLRKLKKCENACIVYHACEWDKNYLGDENIGVLLEFLCNHKDDIEFCFMKDMVNGKV